MFEYTTLKRFIRAFVIILFTNMLISLSKTQVKELEEVTEIVSNEMEDIQPIDTSLLWVGENTGNVDINKVINPSVYTAIDMPVEVSLTEDFEFLDTEDTQNDESIEDVLKDIDNVFIQNIDTEDEDQEEIEESEEITENSEEDNANHAPIYYYVNDNGMLYYMDTDWQDYLYNKLCEYGYENRFKLMVALIYHESQFNPDAISSSNDYGLCQINASNHSFLSAKLGITNFLDPYQSIDCGVYMFVQCLETSDNVESALVKYNQGHSSSNSSTSYSRGVFEDELKLEVL